MSDESGNHTHDGDGTALQYDWFKHLTSLSLLTIGGVLSLSQGAGGAGIKKSLLIIVLVFVGISALLSFSGAAQIVKSRTDGAPLPPSLGWVRAAASMALSMGVGAFTYVFLGTLK